MKLAPTQPVCVNATSLLTQASSSSKSDDVYMSVDETKSTCDSYKSPPRVEYIENEQVSIERKAFSNLYITPISETTTNGTFCLSVLFVFFPSEFVGLQLIIAEEMCCLKLRIRIRSSVQRLLVIFTIIFVPPRCISFFFLASLWLLASSEFCKIYMVYRQRCCLRLTTWRQCRKM